MKTSLLAPCGMNCAVCRAYLRKRNQCPGCRENDKNKSISCRHCKIKNCHILKRDKLTFCFNCETFPCERIRHMDKRYQTRYKMSTIENLNNIKESGLRHFLRNEKIRWTCSTCGATLCVHLDHCEHCGKNR